MKFHQISRLTIRNSCYFWRNINFGFFRGTFLVTTLWILIVKLCVMNLKNQQMHSLKQFFQLYDMYYDKLWSWSQVSKYNFKLGKAHTDMFFLQWKLMAVKLPLRYKGYKIHNSIQEHLVWGNFQSIAKQCLYWMDGLGSDELICYHPGVKRDIWGLTFCKIIDKNWIDNEIPLKPCCLDLA